MREQLGGCESADHPILPVQPRENFWLFGSGSSGLWIGATGCGIAGIILPLVPTTPFLLVAAYAFGRSSPTLHDWLVTHPRFGPALANWRMHGAIARRTKVLALTVMGLMLLTSWTAELELSLLLLQGSVLAAAALFILTRPDAPAGRE